MFCLNILKILSKSEKPLTQASGLIGPKNNPFLSILSLKQIERPAHESDGWKKKSGLIGKLSRCLVPKLFSFHSPERASNTSLQGR